MDVEKLRFEELSDKHEPLLADFDCGDEKYNEFIRKKALMEQYQKINRTTLVFFEDKLVGYYTVSETTVNREKDIDHLNYSKNIHYSKISAYLIGQLAVHKDFQGMGIGSRIVEQCRKEAKELHRRGQCRIICVHAEARPEAVALYQKCKFKPKSSLMGRKDEILKGEYKREDGETILMYRDLWVPTVGNHLYPSDDLYPVGDDDL